MGNAELKAAFKTALKDSQAKEKLGLTTEILLEDSLVTSVEEFVFQKMGVGSLDRQKAFPESNIQANENAEDLYKRQLIAELNENYISGFATAESNIEQLKEPCKIIFTLNQCSLREVLHRLLARRHPGLHQTTAAEVRHPLRSVCRKVQGATRQGKSYSANH